MKGKFAILLLLLSVAGQAQTFSDSLSDILKQKDLAALLQFFDKSKREDPNTVLDRQILADYFERSYETRNVPGNRVCVLTRENRLIYIRHFAAGKLKYQWEDAAAVGTFLTAYKSFFGLKPKMNAFFIDTIRYGSGCGFVGADPVPRSQMEKYVKAGNSKALTKWLQSPVTELQLYGVEGFEKLEQKGFKASPLQRRLVDFIKSKQGAFLACAGCIYTSQPISKKSR
jgi:hypothetical protein